MNKRELIAELSKRMGEPQSKIGRILDISTNAIVQAVKHGQSVQLYGLGTFELRKKGDRILVNPSTKRQMIVPPKLTFVFKPGGVYKERIKNLEYRDFDTEHQPLSE